MPEEDYITYVLSGLGAEYNALVVSVTSKRENFSVSEMSSLLLLNEKILEQQAQLSEVYSTNLVLGSGGSGWQQKINQNFSGQKMNFNYGQRSFGNQVQNSKGYSRGENYGKGVNSLFRGIDKGRNM